MEKERRKLLNAKEAAEYLGISRSSLYCLTSKRKIPFFKSGGGKIVYFDPNELDIWMKAKSFDII